MVIRPALTASLAARPSARPAVSSQAGQGGVDVAAVLAALDELEHPLEDRASARARPAGSEVVG
jgi:hypothetical protein